MGFQFLGTIDTSTTQRRDQTFAHALTLFHILFSTPWTSMIANAKQLLRARYL